MRTHEIRERKAPFTYSSDIHSGPMVLDKSSGIFLPVETLLSHKGVHNVENKRQTN